MTITTRPVFGTNEIIVSFQHGMDNYLPRATSSVSVYDAENEAEAVQAALQNSRIKEFVTKTKEEIMAEGPSDRLDSLLSSQEVVRAKIVELKHEHPELKLGYREAIGGVLNAYRECDLSFVEAVEALEAISEREHGN